MTTLFKTGTGKRLISFLMAFILLSGISIIPGTFTQYARAETPNTFILHYYQFPNARNYNGWDAWIWEKGKAGNGYPFNSSTPDSEGWITLTAQLPGEWTEIGLIVRKTDWSEKSNSSDIMIPLNAGKTTEVWQLHGEDKVYTNKSDAKTSAAPIAALADAPGKILVTMNFAQDNLDPGHFRLFNITDQAYVDVYNTQRSAKSMIVSTDHAQLGAKKSTLKVNKLYEIRYSTNANFDNYQTCAVTMRDILSSYATTATDLGLSYTAANSIFKVWAPTAVSVETAIYKSIDYGTDYDANGKIKNSKLIAPDSKHVMTSDAQGLWTVSVNGNLLDQYYMYKITFPDGTVKYAVDPYARAVSANGQLGAIIKLENTGTVRSLNVEAANNRNLKLTGDTDHIIYEMHIRDFTINPNSGVSTANAGRYRGVFESGTTVPGYPDVKTGIDHLVELGVTTVHLLPTFDGGSVNELGDLSYSKPGAMNWGYDPQNYNVPEGSYSSDPKNPYARITELKELISAMHDRGIRVVMDVVYNHTYSIADGPFDKIVPGYFYRTWDNGSYSNGSGCGNETASERAMVGKFILDSLLYWQKEFGMDGFRFDLMALHDNDTMYRISETLKAVNPNCVIYGEPWTAADTPLAYDKRTTKGQQFGHGFAYFNDDVREAIRGDHSSTTDTPAKDLGGFAGGATTRNGEKIENLIALSVNATNGHLSRASETITYTSKHDNLILWDMMQRAQGTAIYSYHGEEYKPANWNSSYANNPYAGLKTPLSLAQMGSSSSENAARSSLLAVGMVLTMQGIPFLHAGDEILRTKYGSGNSYRDNDTVNAIDWSNKVKFRDAFNYQQGLIHLRNQHPAFRLDSRVVIDSKVQEISKSTQLVVYKIGENAGGDQWKNIYVAYNGSGENKTVYFGNSKALNIVVNNSKAGVDTLGTIASNSSYTLPPYSMVVAYDEAGGYGAPVLTSVKVSPNTADINEKEKVVFGLTYLDQAGNEFFGNTAATVTWESSNTAIATVDQKGIVTGKAPGTATITASVEGFGKVSASVTVHKQRYLVIEYTGSTASQADVWSWEVGGGGSGATPFTGWVEGQWVAVIPVSANVSQVGYIIRKVAANAWDDGNKDVEDDQFITMSPSDQFTVVRVTAGQKGSQSRNTITGVGIHPSNIAVVGFNGAYDGAPHGISVTDMGGGIVTYSTSSNGTYSEASPAFTDPGTYTVYYRVDRGEPWTVSEGTGTVTISGVLPPSQVRTPMVSPNGGMFTDTQVVTLSCDTSGAAIYYTLDGSTPSAASKLYSAPITLAQTTTVKAIAVKAGMTSSAVLSVVFTKEEVTPPPVADENPLFLDAAGKVVSSMSEKPDRVSFTYYNDPTTPDAKLCMLVTVYNAQGVLKFSASSALTFTPGELKTFEIPLGSLELKDGDHAKVFLWEGITQMRDVYTFK
jgi:type I pullulanase